MINFNSNFVKFISQCEEGISLDQGSAQSLNFLERFFRSIGSFFGFCQTTSQKCFDVNVKFLKKQLRPFQNANTESAQTFFKQFRSELTHEVRERLRLLVASPKAKKNLGKVIDGASNITKKHFNTEWIKECDVHYQKVDIQGNSKLKLSAYPKKCEKSVPITEEQKTAFIEDNKDIAEIATKAINGIQQITQSQLDKGLEECVTVLNKHLRELGMPSYAVAVAEEKSSQWCMELATPYLDYAPSSGLSIGGGGVVIGKGKAVAPVGKVEDVKEEVLVLFEDCSYSGRQLDSYLRQFTTQRHEANKPLKIFVVVPFMSQDAFEINQSNIEYRKANGMKDVTVNVITTETRIKSLRDVFPDEMERDKFYFDLAGSSQEASHFALCDWRFPDEASFPERFGKRFKFVQEKKDGSKLVLDKDYLAPQRAVKAPYKI